MAEPKRVALQVVILDPGIACLDGATGKQCVLWSLGRAECLAGRMSMWDEHSQRWMRPQSCKDSEVKTCPKPQPDGPTFDDIHEDK
jgi:hypothetical protein